MARKKAPTIIEKVDPKTWESLEVLKAPKIYAVFYENSPINLRTVSIVEDKEPKYRKTSFPSRSPAVRLAAQLNSEFNTDKFKAMALVYGEPVEKT